MRSSRPVLDSPTQLVVRVLGPVEVTGARGPAPLVGARQRAVVGLLALHAGTTVPTWRLVDALWGDDPPRTATRSLHSHVARVRQALDACGLPDALVTTATGYALMVDSATVDAPVFEEYARQGRDALGEGDHQRAVRLLDAGVALWRQEPALAATEPAGWGARRGGAARRGPAHRDRGPLGRPAPPGSARCGPGGAGAAAGRPPGPGAPGRPADACAVPVRPALRRARRVPPTAGAAGRAARRRSRPGAGPAAHPDPAPRSRPGARGGSPGGRRHRPRGRLRQDGPDRRGRTSADAAPGPTARPGRPLHRPWHRSWRYSTSCSPASVATPGWSPFPGPPASARPRSPCTGPTWSPTGSPTGSSSSTCAGTRRSGRRDPRTPCRTCCAASASRPTGSPSGADERGSLYRSLLHDRRVLVVLDNGGPVDDILPLVPAGPGNLLVVTSRQPLHSLVAHHAVRLIRLAALTGGEAQALLRGLLSPEQVSGDPAAVAELSEVCDRLPLALRIAAAKLAGEPHRTARQLVTELSGADRLDRFTVDGDSRSVRAVFASAYSSLSAPAARLFRQLGLAPGATVHTQLAAAMTGTSDGRRPACPRRAARRPPGHRGRRGPVRLPRPGPAVRPAARHRGRSGDPAGRDAGPGAGLVPGRRVRRQPAHRLRPRPGHAGAGAPTRRAAVRRRPGRSAGVPGHRAGEPAVGHPARGRVTGRRASRRS